MWVRRSQFWLVKSFERGCFENLGSAQNSPSTTCSSALLHTYSTLFVCCTMYSLALLVLQLVLTGTCSTQQIVLSSFSRWLLFLLMLMVSFQKYFLKAYACRAYLYLYEIRKERFGAFFLWQFSTCLFLTRRITILSVIEYCIYVMISKWVPCQSMISS